MDETSTTHATYRYQALPAEELKSNLLPTVAEDGELKSKDHAKPRNGLAKVAIYAALGLFRLIRQPLFSTTAMLSALFYSIQIYLYVDISATYKDVYGFTPSETGLAFMGIGVGMTAGLLAFGLFSDRIMIILAGNGERMPEHRLPLILASAILVSVGLLVSALTAQLSLHWILPVLGNSLTGAGLYTLSVSWPNRTYALRDAS